MADPEKQLPVPAIKDEIAVTVNEKNVQAKIKETNSLKEDSKDVDKKDAPKIEATSDAKMSNYLRILGYGTRLDWFLLGTCVFMAIVAGAAMPLMFLVFGRLVGNFAAYFTPGSGVSRDEFEHSVNMNALFMVYIFIGRFVSSYISMICVRIAGLRISGALRKAYLVALFNQPVSMIDKVSPGKVSTRITTSSNTIQLGISQQFVMFVQSISFTVGLYVVSFIKAPLLTLVASACLPFIVIIYTAVLPFFIKIHKRTEDIREECSALSFEIFQSIRVVVAFGAEGRLHARFYDLLEAAKKNEIKAGPLMGLMMSPIFFANYATFALAFWFGIQQYIKGDVDGVGSITVVLFSVVMAVSNLGRIWSPVMAMTRAATASSELFATIDAEVPDTTGLKGDVVPVDESIYLDDVYFAYPSRPDVQILNGVSMTFEAGKTTAIVGPSGSGKSTIVGLIERWYDLRSKPAAKNQKSKAAKEIKQKNSVSKRKSKDSNESTSSSELGEATITVDGKEEAKTSGKVRIGNVDLADTDAKWWRAQIGLVSQEPFLFADTIYKNVALGLSGTPWQDAPEDEKRRMVIAACKEAHADEYIIKLPEGYDSMVGESGIKLSGGQRQRLAIARSIVKQPSILILDEATSAIDVRTEQIVQKALDRVSKNRTTIVIAHRLSTIKKADKIVVCRKGEIVEQGTHDELVRNAGGVYHGLVNAQALTMGDSVEAEGSELDANNTDRARTTDDDEVERSTESKALNEQTDPSYKDRNFFASFGKLLFEQRSHWLIYSVIILAAAGAGVVYPLQAYIFANLIQIFTLTGQEFVDRGNFWALMFFVLAIGCFLSYFILGWSAHVASQLISTVYRGDYLRDILRKRIEFFDQEGNSAGTLTSLLSGDPRQLEQLLGTEMSMALISIFNLTGCVIVSFVFGWKLSLVGVLTVLPVILLAGYFRIKLEMGFAKLNSAIFMESSQFATEAVGAFRTVTSLIMEDVVNDRYANLLQHHVSSAWRKAFPGTLIFAASDSIDMLCQALVFWYGGKLMADFEYNIIQFFVVYMAVIQGSQAAGTWFSFAPNIAEATTASNRILSLRQTAAEKQSESTTPFNPEGMVTTSRKGSISEEGAVGIEVRDVRFAYKSRNQAVLNGLNLKIKPGQFAALVGASGCGKSTTISLLERFYDATSGNILVGGQDITKVSVDSYRACVSLVAQEATLYEGTIKENITLSVSEKEVTEEAIRSACTAAQIHDFITSLPESYNTKLGPKGVQLSGGQRQRIALARALLRKPKILLLDEATSSLDSESEKLVQEAIEKAAGEGGRTVLAVAHRLATIQSADVIFVMGSGCVLESGNHAELLRKRGVYFQMCQAQALDR